MIRDNGPHASPARLHPAAMCRHQTQEQTSLSCLSEEANDRLGYRQRDSFCGLKRGEGHGTGDASLEVQLDWLRDAGFDEADCFWKEMGRSVIVGFRTTAQNDR